MEVVFDKEFDPQNIEKELPPEIFTDEKNYEFFSESEKYIGKYTDFIIPFVNEEKIIIGRKFLDKCKKIKYVEIFKNKKMEILGLSSNITFLHKYLEDKKEHYEQDKFIGFRYYASYKNDKKEPYAYGNYFTLVRKNYSKYFILEKNDSLIDINGNKFYDEKINCYQIMKKIMFEKYKNKSIGYSGDIFPEIIGYCFSLVYSIKDEKIIFLEPLIANLENKFCLEESVKSGELKKGIVYVEPFIYDGHISTIIFVNTNTGRYNILLDMSHYHFKNEYSLFSFLPKSLRLAYSFIFPKKDIQAYSSCCIWFIGIIECLLANKKYSIFQNIYLSLKNDNLEFYIEIINLLSKEIEGKDELIKVIEKKEKVFTPDKIDFDRYPFCDSKQYLEINKDIIYNKYLDIEKFIDLKIFISPYKRQIFFNSQNYLERIYEFKSILLFNLKFYDLFPKNEDMKKEVKAISDSISSIDQQINMFMENYDYAFYDFNISFYCLYIDSVLDKIKKPHLFDKTQKKQILDFDYTNFMSTMTNNCTKLIENIKKKATIFSQETIVREINSLNELCFNLMNK